MGELPAPGTARTRPSAVDATPWGELVTAALLGVERRTPPGGSVGALLDIAAAQTVRRRAGARPSAARPRPEPAPEDRRPPLPTAAAQRLSLLLANRTGGGSGTTGSRRGPAPDLGELLPQWLAAANAHGYRAPVTQLPALLDAARARTDLRAQTLAFAGPRAVWLAQQNDDWKFALRDGVRQRAPLHGQSGAAGGTDWSRDARDARDARGARGARAARGEESEESKAADTGGAAGEGGAGDRGKAADRDEAAVEEDGGAAQRTWEEGLFAERVALLGALRRREPAAGLALLASTWQSERAEDRLMFLDSLRQGLSPEDEPFLERALSDRSRTVRATAAELLTSLPGSALAARMAARARTCVAPSHTDHTAGEAPLGIVVEAPHECDATMQRDGIDSKPPAGRGERAWWLGQLVEAAPLHVWSERLGGRSPEQIVALPVADGWRDDLHTAWCGAAVRQRNATWARALIGPPTDPFTGGPGDPAKLLSVLPEEERGAWAAGFIATHGLSEAFRILGACGVPWSLPLGRAVVDALEIAREAGSYPWSFSGVMGLAERCLDPSDAERLAPFAAIPDVSETESPGAGAYWAESFQRLVATLRLRATMLAELHCPAPAGQLAGDA